MDMFGRMKAQDFLENRERASALMVREQIARE
jgi:hypothetical protein